MTVSKVGRAVRMRGKVPLWLTWYCRLMGVFCVVSALSAAVVDWEDNLSFNVYCVVWVVIGLPSLPLGALLLMLSTALRRRKRPAFWVFLAAFCIVGPIGSALIDLAFSGSQAFLLGPIPVMFWVACGIQLAFMGVVMWARPEFVAKGDPANPKLALGVLAGLFALSAALGTTLVAATDSSHSSLADHITYMLRQTAISADIYDFSTPVVVPHWVDLLCNVLGALLLLGTMYALFLPRRGRALHAAPDDERLRCLLSKHGARDSLGYFALRADKAVMFSPTGKAAITYRALGGVSLASGDPIGDPEAWPGAIDAWLEQARAHGWVPAVLGASEEGATVLTRHGLEAIELGDEAVLEVPEFTLEGRPMRVVRQAYNRVQRAGYKTQVRRHREIPDDEMRTLVDHAERWRDGSVERGFSMALSRLGDPADGDCVLIECYGGGGEIKGLLSFVPWGPDGLSLDLMRRSRDSDNGLVEFMVIELIRACPDLGVDRISLNFAMFRAVFERTNRIGAGPFLKLTRRVLSLFSRWWQIESLYRANLKFRPVWEPRFLLYPAARDLPRIGIACGRAEGFISTPRLRHRRELGQRHPPHNRDNQRLPRGKSPFSGRKPCSLRAAYRVGAAAKALQNRASLQPRRPRPAPRSARKFTLLRKKSLLTARISSV
jgi:lysyl-tRNA synthetase class 2